MEAANVIPPFDFTGALKLSVSERYGLCLERARVLSLRYQKFCDYPCVPDKGATPEELARMEADFGRPIPDEYRAFLEVCRYIKIDDGKEIGGFDHENLYVTEIPWVSKEHHTEREFLVFAAYWGYADGDQLLIDLNADGNPVFVYLHEHGPKFEEYASSFSLALWRLVNEQN